ncbi:MAG: POTRA domain-containing protein [bacterium]
MLLLFIICSFQQINLQGAYHFPDTLREKLEFYPHQQEIGYLILDYYVNHGFPYAQINVDNILYQDSELVFDFLIAEGPRVEVNRITFSGNHHTSPSLLQAVSRLPDSFTYSQDLIEQAVENINRLDFIEILNPPKLFYSNRIEQGILNIHCSPRAANNIFGGITYSPQEEELNGNIILHIKNILGLGHQIKIYWNKLNRNSSVWQSDLKLVYLFSKPLNADLKLLYREQEEYQRILAKLTFSLIFKNLEIYSGLEYHNIVYDTFEITQLSNVSGFAFDYRDHFYSPTKGWLFSTEVTTGKISYFNLQNYISSVHLNGEQYIPWGWFTYYLWEHSDNLFSSRYPDEILYKYGGASRPRGYLPESFNAKNALLITMECRYMITRFNYLYPFVDMISYRKTDPVLTNFGYGIGFSSGNDKFTINADISANPELKKIDEFLISTDVQYNF